MKVIYGISRWTNASRPRKRHIPDMNGKPLCNWKGTKIPFTTEHELGEPNCLYCIKRNSDDKI